MSNESHPSGIEAVRSLLVDYSDLGSGAAISGTLRLWRLDGAGWLPLPGVDDPMLGQLTSLTDHFSRFAIFGATNRILLPVLLRP